MEATFSAWLSKVIFKSNGSFTFDKSYEKDVEVLSEGIAMTETDESLRLYVRAEGENIIAVRSFLGTKGLDAYACKTKGVYIVGKAKRHGTGVACQLA